MRASFSGSGIDSSAQTSYACRCSTCAQSNIILASGAIFAYAISTAPSSSGTRGGFTSRRRVMKLYSRSSSSPAGALGLVYSVSYRIACP